MNRDPAAFVKERREEILALLREMIACDSVTGREGPMAELCARWLRAHGIEAILQPCKDRHNAIGVVGKGENALVISGHLDTVPYNVGDWRFGPHTPTLHDGKLYGLGSSDLKASIVGAYFASLYLKECDLRGRYVTAFTIEEETTGDGTELFLQWAEKERFLDFGKTACVVTEPTGLTHLSLGNRGSTFLVVKIKGLGGHGSRPHLARNPIGKAREILAEVPALEAQWAAAYGDPDLGRANLTPTSLNAGDIDRTNVIPEVATLVLDCRVTPRLYADDFKIFRTEMARFLGRFAQEGYEITSSELFARVGHKLEKTHPLAKLVLSVLRDDLGIAEAEFRFTPAANDAVYFGMRGIPTVNKIGPGHPECAHRVDEYVAVENVLRGVEFFIRLGLRYLEAR